MLDVVARVVPDGTWLIGWHPLPTVETMGYSVSSQTGLKTKAPIVSSEKIGHGIAAYFEAPQLAAAAIIATVEG
jgi:hypothetical protein